MDNVNGSDEGAVDPVLDGKVSGRHMNPRWVSVCH